MLDSLPKFAELLFSDNTGLLPWIAVQPLTQSGSPRMLPRDPSSLALALSGFVTLALYLAASGWRKSRAKLTSAKQSRVVSSQRAVSENCSAEQRDAA